MRNQPLTVGGLIGFALILLVSCIGSSAPTSDGTETAFDPAKASANRTISLTVFAAASLTDAFQEIGHQFEATYPGTRVAFNFAGSQRLALQIEQGASSLSERKLWWPPSDDIAK